MSRRPSRSPKKTRKNGVAFGNASRARRHEVAREKEAEAVLEVGRVVRLTRTNVRTGNVTEAQILGPDLIRIGADREAIRTREADRTRRGIRAVIIGVKIVARTTNLVRTITILAAHTFLAAEAGVI